MLSKRAHILCVGTEPNLLELRCAVLQHVGYETRTSTPREAESLLETEQFDLVVLSARLSDEERRLVLAAAGDTPTLVLEGLMMPRDLLKEVERRLSKVA